MNDHPSESHREWLTGIVTRVYPDTWEVDVRTLYGTSGVLYRVKVLSHFLPEIHTTTRQSKVLVGWTDAYQQGPVAIPIHNPIIPADQMANYTFWSEHRASAEGDDTNRKGFRITIDRSGNLVIRTLHGPVREIRILDADGVLRLDTPSTRLVLKEQDQSAELHCEGNATISAGKDLTATAGGKADVKAAGDATLESTGGNVSLTSPVQVTVTAPTINLNGNVVVP